MTVDDWSRPLVTKVAPWEAAYIDWGCKENGGCSDADRFVWQAAWAACEQHYNIETGGEA
jgi:hypothetical protein